jgi:hypothetical protein
MSIIRVNAPTNQANPFSRQNRPPDQFSPRNSSNTQTLMKTRSLLVLSAILLLLEAHAPAFYDPGTGRWLSKDPIEERGGLNLYECSSNSLVNIIDPLGMDFIAVGSSYAIHQPIGGGWQIALRGAGHLMLTFWRESFLCIREGARKEENASRNPTAWLTTWRPVYNNAVSTEVVQMGFTDNWEMKYSKHFGFFNWNEVDNPHIAEIHITPSDSDADQYRVIYADTPGRERAASKWNTIKSYAATYGFAEHAPFTKGRPATNWPNSHYGHLALDWNFNNSNTFIHAMAATIGRTVPLGGWGGRSHPGNIVPEQVSDSRPAPVYKP